MHTHIHTVHPCIRTHTHTHTHARTHLLLPHTSNCPEELNSADESGPQKMDDTENPSGSVSILGEQTFSVEDSPSAPGDIDQQMEGD